jgi:restriction endonuclease S subunit
MRDGWVETTLGELAEITTGSRAKGGAITSGIPSIGGEQIAEDRSIKFNKMKFVPEKHFESMRTGKLKFGDSLLVKDGATTGKVGYWRYSIPAAVNEHVFILRARPDTAEPYFINLLISHQSFRKEIESRTRGIIGGITRDIENIEFIVPLLPEQKRIVDLISSVDSYIEALQQQLVSIQSIRSSISESFWSLFSLRSKLSSFGETLTGSTPPTKKLQYWESHDVDFFTPSDLGTSQKLNTANRGVSNQGAAISRPLKGFSVLQVCIGATIGKVGYLNHPAVMNQQINALTNLAEHDAPILAAILSSETFQSIIKNTAGGSTLPIISKSSWGEIEIPNVPEGERINISLTVLELDSSIEQSRQLLLSAEKLRSSILHNLLSGEHQIPASYDKVIGAA